MNYFSPQTAAERYARGRPYFHTNTIARIKARLLPEARFGRALDIACGTGLSTKALLEIADEVNGTDISAEMLRWAPKDDRIHYTLAPAEQQPFPNNDFDLVTVGSGVHWFDIDRFLAEALRLLKSKAWLVLYENHFIAEMVGHPGFTPWFQEVYIKKFPSPPRNDQYAWTPDNLEPKGFLFCNEEKFKNSVCLDRKQLALYFTTQSNIIAAVENRETTYEEAEEWLDKELSAFFPTPGTQRTIHYGNWIKYLQRMG